jgi:predicted nucleic acid-binding protein
MPVDSGEILVFDTGPLSHFARQNWLGVLKAVVGERTAVVPDVVVDELRTGAARDSRVQAVLDANWIEHRELRTAEEIVAFARFSALLVRGDRNRGEAGVLALAFTTGGVAVVDDGAARRAATTHGVGLRPTLSLLCEAIRLELLTVKLVSALADDLLASEYRLPFGPGGFETWASENGVLP